MRLNAYWLYMARYQIMSSNLKANHLGKINQVFNMVGKYTLVETKCPGAHLHAQGIMTSCGPFAH